MRFTTVEDIKNLGFVGFIRIADLQADNTYGIIPKDEGIYMILRIATTTSEFLAVNPSAMHSNQKKNPASHSYDLSLLQAKSEKVKESIVVYIGKAGGGTHKKTHKKTLHKRLKDYMVAGKPTAKSSSHAGGRAIWQFKDSVDLIVCWKTSDNEDAIELEHRLLDEFKAEYNSLPLANWKR